MLVQCWEVILIWRHGMSNLCIFNIHTIKYSILPQTNHFLKLVLDIYLPHPLTLCMGGKRKKKRCIGKWGWQTYVLKGSNKYTWKSTRILRKSGRRINLDMSSIEKIISYVFNTRCISISTRNSYKDKEINSIPLDMDPSTSLSK